MRVSIYINEPWEIGGQVLKGELLHIIDDEHGGRGLIKLDNYIDYKGSSWRYVVATPRHHEQEQENKINGLNCCKKIVAVFFGISEQQAHLEHHAVLDTIKWRGGLAFEGDVEPAN